MNNMNQMKLILIGLTLLSYCTIFAQDSTTRKIPLIIDYSFLDLPSQHYSSHITEGEISTQNQANKGTLSKAFSIQSMEQSFQITNAIAQTMHWGIAQIPVFKKRPVLQKITHALITIPSELLISQFYGNGWRHEEGHRAILANSYVYSYNPLVLFNKKPSSGSTSVASVAYILDTNLVMMKENNNANFVRMSTVGAETEISALNKMQRNTFFYGQKTINSINYLITAFSVSGYIKTCADKDQGTKLTLETMAKEGSNQNLRDFTGLDFTAWAYDLFNPTSKYSERGLNPYGNGYDRYIYGDKLTTEQYDWLKKQANLSYLNFISPAMFFINEIKLKNDASFNFSGRYYPTSFGNQIGIDLFFKNSKFNIFVSPHLNQNYENNFFGIEAMIFEKPVKIKQHQFLTTTRIVADLQPKNQSFKTSSADFTGLVELNMIYKASKHFYPYVSFEAKSKGWIAGNAFLDERFSIKAGLSVRFNYSK
jgi:hypothetical protein